MLSEDRTQVAEQKLKPDKSGESISHPETNDFFSDCAEGV